jgi:hypothetical protein
MASQIEICNGALIQLGASSILSLTEDSKNARVLNQRYNMVRDRVFREHPWNCLTKRIKLAQDTTAPTYEFTFAYTLPSDNLRILKFADIATSYAVSNDIEYKIENGKLLTDSGSVYILYVARITDTEVYDTSLVETLSAALAADIAYSITGSTTMLQLMEEKYLQKLKDARFADATEGMPDEIDSDYPFIASRY